MSPFPASSRGTNSCNGRLLLRRLSEGSTLDGSLWGAIRTLVTWCGLSPLGGQTRSACNSGPPLPGSLLRVSGSGQSPPEGLTQARQSSTGTRRRSCTGTAPVVILHAPRNCTQQRPTQGRCRRAVRSARSTVSGMASPMMTRKRSRSIPKLATAAIWPSDWPEECVQSVGPADSNLSPIAVPPREDGPHRCLCRCREDVRADLGRVPGADCSPSRKAWPSIV
jgi:hypothetical protein